MLNTECVELNSLAGVDRFELSRARVKVLCLTAWRYPIVIFSFKAKLCRDLIFSAIENILVFSGASRGIRTPDPRLRRAMLYPAELLTHVERVKGSAVSHHLTQQLIVANS